MTRAAPETVPIFPSRLHLGVAVIIVLLLGVGSAGVITGFPRERVEARKERDELKSSLQTRFRSINSTHDRLSKQRRATTDALSQQEKIMDLLRAPGGVGLAQAEAAWAAAKVSYGEARTSLLADETSLIYQTEALIAETKAAEKQMDRLILLLDAPSDIEYLKALDTAYGLLRSSHELHLQTYRVMESSLGVYESLYQKTDTLLTERARGAFREPRAASIAYVQRTNELVAPLASARGQISELRQKIEAAEKSAASAFARASALDGSRGR